MNREKLFPQILLIGKNFTKLNFHNDLHKHFELNLIVQELFSISTRTINLQIVYIYISFVSNADIT